MHSSSTEKGSRAVGIWLLIGVAMIVIQIILGGITRLTESGLSITEWKPVTGALPPMNENAWMQEFDKYRNTTQFRDIHSDFTIKDFKFIFFWEWFHRLWARMLGVVFLAGFVYFLVKKKFKQEMILPMVILFILGALQGAIGWLMVKSGLVPEKEFVGHIELTTHFIAALILLSYTYWFAMKLLVPQQQMVRSNGLRKLLYVLLAVLTVQLIYGGFMAGLKAATAAPTWPDINGKFIPDGLSMLTPWAKNLTDNKIMVQFIHRMNGYLLFIVIVVWGVNAGRFPGTTLFGKLKRLPLILCIFQITLGVLTVLYSYNPQQMIWYGITHQFVGMLLLISVVSLLYVVREA
jgi:heme a synthase